MPSLEQVEARLREVEKFVSALRGTWEMFVRLGVGALIAMVLFVFVKTIAKGGA